MRTLVYSSDDNYAALTAISAVSALRWNPGLGIVLMGNALKDESLELVRSRVEAHGGTFRYFDVSDRLAAIAAKGFTGYTSYAAYSRIFIADLLSGESGRIVYLDCDTLVTAPLDTLFDFDLRGRPFGFGYDCIERHYKDHVKVAPTDPYYNSGVMLADLAAWRSSGASAALEAEFAHPRGPNPLGDQDMLVRAWRDYTTPLPPRYNCLSQYFLFSHAAIRKINGLSAPWATAAEYAEARRAPAILHFSGGTLGRPWYTSSKHPMREAYRQAAAEAGLGEKAEQTRPLDLSYRVQYLLWRLLPRFLFEPACRALYRINIRRNYGV